MPTLPQLDITTNTNQSPHVVILGAGASVAACPLGEVSGRRLPLMRNFVETIGLAPLLQSHGIRDGYDDFESLYDGLLLDERNGSLLADLELKVREYFAGMGLPPQATIYDRLLLSLRSKDVIATFNWDPLLGEAVKRNRDVCELPRILFLHGNVDVGVCVEHKTKGFYEHTCNVCRKSLSPSRLLFPVKHKDYTSDPFIMGEWEELRWYIQHAYLITVFGYSAPVADLEAKRLLLEAWQGNSTRDFAHVEIVDIRPRAQIEESWSSFMVRQNYSILTRIDQTLSFMYVRRSCEAFAMATLQQHPWKENRFPDSNSLEHVRKWLQPLISEERGCVLSGRACSRI